MEIGLLGATGPAGRALAARLASVGCDVTIGSRSKYRALEVRDEIVSAWPTHDLMIKAGENSAAAQREIVIIATPWDAAAGTASSVADHLGGKVVICMSNALQKVGDEFLPLVPPRGSVSASVQAEVPSAFVAAGMHHVPANELANIEQDVDSDVLVCSDHSSATLVAMDLVNLIPGLRALDAGHLSNAMAIEAFTAVLLQLNVRYKTRAAVKFTGIDLAD
ncbi:MAG: NADPH-dependent F420 reductase [Acidobacteria bacterium]|nr:NADPH-dependent F420 reductase [Acidobacteriota bacterium]